MRTAAFDEVAQQCRIIAADGRFDLCPRCQAFAPARELRLARQNAEIADRVEHIEIAEHRPKDRVDQREALTIEPWTNDARFQPCETLLELRGLGLEDRFVRRRVEPGNIIKDRGAEFDEGPM